MFLCNIPIPPACAIAIAKSASVTVSIAADTSGIFRRIFFVSCVLVSTSRGQISELAGINKTSSYVRPSATNFCGSNCIWQISLEFLFARQNYVFFRYYQKKQLFYTSDISFLQWAYTSLD